MKNPLNEPGHSALLSLSRRKYSVHGAAWETGNKIGSHGIEQHACQWYNHLKLKHFLNQNAIVNQYSRI